MITTVIFGLDDTLYNEIDFCRSGFEILLERLGARPHETVYVGDNETKDFIAPNRLGLVTVQLARPNGLYRRPAPLPDATAHVKIDRIDALAGIISRF
jgi:FMN phosphatase YigB (HAD superfamily)